MEANERTPKHIQFRLLPGRQRCRVEDEPQVVIRKNMPSIVALRTLGYLHLIKQLEGRVRVFLSECPPEEFVGTACNVFRVSKAHRRPAERYYLINGKVARVSQLRAIGWHLLDHVLNRFASFRPSWSNGLSPTILMRIWILARYCSSVFPLGSCSSGRSSKYGSM